MSAAALLKPDLLQGRVVALARGARPALERELSAVGARVVVLGEAGGEGGADALDALVYDAAAAFGSGGDEALRRAVDEGWEALHAAATGALIPSGRGGAIVLIAPPAHAGPRAGAARAALENTARTLSVEWARFAITTTAIAPGEGTSDEEIATLVAYLVSAAGAYLSGCRFDLGAVA